MILLWDELEAEISKDPTLAVIKGVRDLCNERMDEAPIELFIIGRVMSDLADDYEAFEAISVEAAARHAEIFRLAASVVSAARSGTAKDELGALILSTRG